MCKGRSSFMVHLGRLRKDTFHRKCGAAESPVAGYTDHEGSNDVRAHGQLCARAPAPEMTIIQSCCKERRELEG